jgi:hypothetical protein
MNYGPINTKIAFRGHKAVSISPTEESLEQISKISSFYELACRLTCFLPIKSYET